MNIRLISAMVLSTLSISAVAGDFSIKGMEIGASIEAYRDSFKCSPGKEGLLRCYQIPATVTVGGEKLKAISLRFGSDEKIETIAFNFAPDAFPGIRDAVTQKYPNIKCTKGVVKTRMGIELATETCFGKTVDENIEIEKYGSSIDSGGLIIIKNSVLDQSMKKRQESRSDI